jgi:hypothetical protein
VAQPTPPNRPAKPAQAAQCVPNRAWAGPAGHCWPTPHSRAHALTARWATQQAAAASAHVAFTRSQWTSRPLLSRSLMRGSRESSPSSRLPCPLLAETEIREGRKRGQGHATREERFSLSPLLPCAPRRCASYASVLPRPITRALPPFTHHTMPPWAAPATTL